MKYIRWAFLAILAIVLVSVALANRQMVTLTLLPEGLAEIFGLNQSIALPMFMVIFISIVVGLLLGFCWEWMREHKHRSEARNKDLEAQRLNRELKREKKKNNAEKGQDDVLALID